MYYNQCLSSDTASTATAIQRRIYIRHIWYSAGKTPQWQIHSRALSSTFFTRLLHQLQCYIQRQHSHPASLHVLSCALHISTLNSSSSGLAGKYVNDGHCMLSLHNFDVCVYVYIILVSVYNLHMYVLPVL